MKHLARFLTLIAVFAFSGAGRAAEPASASNPADTIRSFYPWYVTALLADHDPMKNRAQMKRFVTDRLLNEIEKMVKGPDGLDGDYFVDAQDFDKQWAKRISVSNIKIRGTKATADVLLAGTEMTRKLSINLVNEGGTWKIDKVQGDD